MILCCGEALMDMIPFPTGSGQDGFVPHPGGSVFNTAIGLGRLGVKTGLLTGLSTDMFGTLLLASLRDNRVDTDHVILSDRPTTLAFVHLVSGQASYSFFDENSAGRMLTPNDVPKIPKSVQAMFFGGISLACEPAADTFATLLENEKTDRLVMLDPNVRPSFISDEGRYRARLNRMLSQSDIVKTSDDDLDCLFPGPSAIEDKAVRLLSKGPTLVVLTRGDRGASVFTSDGRDVSVSAKPVQVVDTVGAGDAFNAGFLTRLSELDLLSKEKLTKVSTGMITDCLGLAVEIAALTVARSGASPPGRHDVSL
ncbi:MAG: carbohydrate kinase [Pseudomonadota bacterium]